MPIVADLSGVIALVGAAYTVTRVTPPVGPAFVDGLPSAATLSSVLITASIQPLSGQQLRTRPELRDLGGAMRLFTATALQTQPPDRLTYQGHEYEVTQLLDWYEVGNYGEYVITQREVG